MTARDRLARLVAGPALDALRVELAAQREILAASAATIDGLRAELAEAVRELGDLREEASRVGRTVDELLDRNERRDAAIEDLAGRIETLRLDQRAAERQGEWHAEAQRTSFTALAERMEALARRAERPE